MAFADNYNVIAYWWIVDCNGRHCNSPFHLYSFLMYIIGFSAFYHDSAACILKNGVIMAAVQEERFSRIKHDASFPYRSIQYCLSECNIKFSEIDHIVFYDKPFTKFERILETHLAFAPKGFQSFCKSMPIWIKEKLFQKKLIINELKKNLDREIDWSKKLLFSEHHLSHASSAFFPSPFERAAVLTMDGVGEWATTSLALGEGNNLSIEKEIFFPHSIGLLYSAFTYFTGFKVNSGEYKVMGLAPYGEPKFVNIIKNNLIDIKDDGSFFIDISYFDYCTGNTMTNHKFSKLFGKEPRKSEDPLTQLDMDLAASIQKIVEEVILKLGKNIKKETGEKNLCLAGGVALNCVANGNLYKANIFENIWCQPAAGDAGGALGAALAVHYLKYDNLRNLNGKKDQMNGSYLGPKFSEQKIEKSLKSFKAIYKKLDENELIKFAADALSKELTIGWMSGSMEFGPRALGNRSIIADPRSPKMQKLLNQKIKFRESFRPFAPSILEEDQRNWFDLNINSPYMLLVANVKKDISIELNENEKKLFGIEKLNTIRSSIPAVTHVDYSARIQTVSKETNPKYYALISEFKKLTNCPLIINTSFNIRGEPIVCTPEDAFKCFMTTGLDILIIENFVLKKDQQTFLPTSNNNIIYKLD